MPRGRRSLIWHDTFLSVTMASRDDRSVILAAEKWEPLSIDDGANECPCRLSLMSFYVLYINRLYLSDVLIL